MQFQYYSMNSSAQYLRTEGRITMAEDGLAMTWSACGFSLRFRGSGIVLTFAPFREMQPIFALAVLDGVRHYTVFSDGNEPVILDCAPGEHTLTFLRLSEGCTPLVCTGFRISSMAKDKTPAVLPSPEAYKRKLTFFGDSITCGYGVCSSASSGQFLTWEEDATRAYAYRTAEMLGAEAEIVSISGQGVVKNCMGFVDTPIPTFWCHQNRILSDPYDESRQPDAVIVNAGTNDCGGGVTKEEFYAGAEAFLRRLRSAYPAAEIVWFYGLMSLEYDDVLRAVTEKLQPELGHITYLPTAMIYDRPEEIGANGHPSAEGAERAARELSDKLKELLAW